MLFEPTFVIPDVRNGLGAGTVDVKKGMTVSWRVKGQPYMAAFEIVIYKNDTASTQVFSTGRKTDNCPFYGTDPEGNAQFFSYSITASELSAAGVVNGREYKLLITQWWSETDFITQSSASAFITRTTPTLSVEPIGTGGVIETRYWTFNGVYQQAQGDTLNWVRWRIATAGNTQNPFFDTGELSGVSQLQATYDGFFTGVDYAVRLTIQTEKGIEADTGWISFSVQYEMQDITGIMTAENRCTSALIDWSNIAYINGEPSGPYSVSGGMLELPEGSSVTWSKSNRHALSFKKPWYIIYRGVIKTAEDAVLFSVGQSGGAISLNYSAETKKVTLKKGDVVLAEEEHPMVYDPTVTVILTSTYIYFRIDYVTVGLFPSTTLYPSATLYPSGVGAQVVMHQYKVKYTQQKITYVRVSGASTVDYIETVSGTPDSVTIQQAYLQGTYVPEWKDSDYMLADFTNGISAGNLDTSGVQITGFALYRRVIGGNTLQRVATTDLSVQSIYDYGVRSQQGPYQWYLFPIGENNYVIRPIISNSINSCFWNWCVLECAPLSQKGHYSVLAEYRFGKNLSSGTTTNNNTPSIRGNFTRYPTVQRSHSNYQSGTLSSMIGVVDAQGRYSDTLSMRDAIYQLSTTENTLFLKSRKGDLLQIAIAGPITMITMDNTAEQAQSTSIPWVETGSTENVSLVANSAV